MTPVTLRESWLMPLGNDQLEWRFLATGWARHDVTTSDRLWVGLVGEVLGGDHSGRDRHRNCRQAGSGKTPTTSQVGEDEAATYTAARRTQLLGGTVRLLIMSHALPPSGADRFLLWKPKVVPHGVQPGEMHSLAGCPRQYGRDRSGRDRQWRRLASTRTLSTTSQSASTANCRRRLGPSCCVEGYDDNRSIPRRGRT